MLGRVCLASALACLGAIGGAHAQAEEAAVAQRSDDGARAPDDAWLQDDGCPARTGATDSPAMTQARVQAWKFEVPGEVEGEPLAWRGKTFVVERSGLKRTVHVLHSATGAVRYRQSFTTPLPLAPCVHEGRIVLRTSPKTVQGFAVGEKALTLRWTVTAKEAVGPPVLLRNEVYLVVDGVLERRAYGSKVPVWPKAGTPPVRAQGVSVAAAGAKVPLSEYPRPSVRGGSVWLATGTRLVEVDRHGGAVRREGSLEASADPRSARVCVGAADLVVTGLGAAGGGEPAGRTARFSTADPSRLEAWDGFRAPTGLAAVGGGWVGAIARKDPAFVRVRGADASTDGALELATPKVHPEVLEAKVPPSVAGTIVFVGGRAFDARSLRVLQGDPLPSLSRTIPLRDRLLVVEGKGRVTAWRRAVAPPPVAPLAPAAEDAAAGALPAARAVLEDGRILSGGFVLDAKARVLRGTGKPGDAGAWPLSGVAALLTDEAPRRFVLAADPRQAVAAAVALSRSAAGAALAGLVADAAAAGDEGLAVRALTAAAERGAPEAAIAVATKALAAMEAAPPERSEEKAAAVEARLTALIAQEADDLVEAASALPSSAPAAYATALVRAAVERAPYHAGATEWVRAHLPAGVEPRGFRDLADWLDFLDTVAGGSLRVLAPGAPAPEGAPTAATEALAAARTAWREDLVGFLNGPLLVVSPPERPGAIARCLTLGRVVSDALDAAFASAGPRRADEDLLVLQLFSSKGEYLAQSRGGGEGGFGTLEHSAGHYSPGANVTRIFFPASDDAEDSVEGTYAHELTHHWISRRRPARAEDGGAPDRAGGPGYFVVEGFADFAKDFDYDLGARTARPENPRAEYADIVAGLPDAAVIPWASLLAMTQAEAYTGMEQGEVKVPLRWRMGTEGRFTRGNIYYAQAAATTAYLYLAEEGRHRPALIDFLYDHYAGRADPTVLLAAVGMTADDLGTRIVRWCRSLGAPPKPPAPRAPRPK